MPICFIAVALIASCSRPGMVAFSPTKGYLDALGSFHFILPMGGVGDMTIVQEMADAIKLLADLVKNTRELAKAVNDGREYLVRQHPEAKASLVEMLAEMQTTVEGLARVTAVVTSFRFTTSGAARDFEPARFNKYVIDQSEKLTKLRGNLRKLKGSCEKIREARDKLNELAGNRGDWAAMFRLFGKQRRQRDTELASALSNFYADDQRMIEVVRNILALSEKALKEADKTLGPPGQASPYNAEKAASVLNVYALVFEDAKGELDALVETLERTALDLG